MEFKHNASIRRHLSFSIFCRDRTTPLLLVDENNACCYRTPEYDRIGPVNTYVNLNQVLW